MKDLVKIFVYIWLFFIFTCMYYVLADGFIFPALFASTLVVGFMIYGLEKK